MDVKPIRTEADYEFALMEIDALMEVETDTPERDRLEVLSALVEAYEQQYFPIDPPDPIAAIRFRMEQMGLSRKDLEPMIGSRGRISEVMSGKRGLSLAMIRRLHKDLNIPAEVLIQKPPKRGKARNGSQ